MKKLLLTLSLFAFTVCLYAQAVKKVEKIREEEVPAAVRIAFSEAFGKIPEDGYWTVNFNVVSEGDKRIAQPTWYTYRKGSGHEKIEVRYSPAGKLEHAKGIRKLADS